MFLGRTTTNRTTIEQCHVKLYYHMPFGKILGLQTLIRWTNHAYFNNMDESKVYQYKSAMYTIKLTLLGCLSKLLINVLL